MEKKEYHKANLPHFQQPGQAYFVTWNLKDAIPPIAYKEYTKKLTFQRNIIESAERQKLLPEQINKLKSDYYILRKKLIKSMDDLMLLNNKTIVNLSKTENTAIIFKAIRYWENVKLINHAICVMPNHVHWIFQLNERDNNGNLVWLEDILKSVKQFSATEINKNEHLSGQLWHKESWDTTIRDPRHLYDAIEYTKNNPVVAGFVKDWKDWKGTIVF